MGALYFWPLDVNSSPSVFRVCWGMRSNTDGTSQHLQHGLMRHNRRRHYTELLKFCRIHLSSSGYSLMPTKSISTVFTCKLQAFLPVWERTDRIPMYMFTSAVRPMASQGIHPVAVVQLWLWCQNQLLCTGRVLREANWNHHLAATVCLNSAEQSCIIYSWYLRKYPPFTSKWGQHTPNIQQPFLPMSGEQNRGVFVSKDSCMSCIS